MTIEVIGKHTPVEYTTTCTDTNCRAILKFNQDDIKYNETYSMGRKVDSHSGIVCPLCNQVLKKEDFVVHQPQTKVWCPDCMSDVHRCSHMGD